MFIECSKDLFKVHRIIWQLSGLIAPKKHRLLYFLWSFVFNITIIIWYPVHLVIGLLESDTKADIFKNLAVVVAVIACSVKFVILRYHLADIERVENILDILDKCVQTNDEELYFNEVIQSGKVILIVFGMIFGSASVSSELSTLIDSQKRLMYPAWFPMDWQANNVNYWIANMYQFIGILLQITCNFASDTFPPVCVALLSGHVRLLGLRVSKLGTNPGKDQQDNNTELKHCIMDHQNLIDLYHGMQVVISKGMFLQLVVTGMNICCIIIYLVFFSENFFSTVYFTLYLIALCLEIFPCCYYGSVFEMEFTDLPYAIFSSNWMDQSVEFKKNVIMFSARCFQSTSLYCLGLFRIHLDTFYVTMKSAYSLFAVVVQSK